MRVKMKGTDRISNKDKSRNEAARKTKGRRKKMQQVEDEDKDVAFLCDTG